MRQSHYEIPYFVTKRITYAASIGQPRHNGHREETNSTKLILEYIDMILYHMLSKHT